MVLNIPPHIKTKTLDDYLKFEYYQKILLPLKGKNVLDVGCVEDNLDKANLERIWNHWFIFQAAAKTTGIDVVEDSIKRMRSMGFNVFLMNAEKIKFNTKFDVVFAGELIEHLTNPGLFLQSAASVLKRGGKIVLTTPNAFSVNRLVRVVQHVTNDPPNNPDHTLYFTPATIRKLAELSGLRVSKIDYAYFPFLYSSPLVGLNKLFCKLLGNRFKEQMVVTIERL